MPDVDRRAFVKELALASAAAAVPGALAPRAAAAARAREGPAWHRAPCPLCGVGCGLLVAVENGRAVAVKGDPDSPASRGLACVKGYHAVQALYGRDRIARALVRRGEALVETPLGEALDLVARRLRETTERYGKDAVALYGSAQWTAADARVAALLAGAVGTRSVDVDARLRTASAAAGLRSAFGLDGAVGCHEDLDHADVFVVWGANLAETDPVLFSRMLARRRGSPAARIVVLGTRATRTSWAADETLLHAPHAELAIVNALCQEIVARRWVDRAFVARHVALRRGQAATGAATDASWDDYVRFLAAYTPEAVERLSGVPAESIRWLASLYADRSRRVTTVWGAGVNASARGTWTNEALHAVHLLVGKVASPGNGAFGLTGDAGAGGGDASGAGAPADGRDALAIFRALERGDVRFLWVQGANPAAELPDAGRYRRAMAAPDRFVVVSDAYPTATTAAADVVLPAATWIEREGVLVSAERRAQHSARLVAPPGDAADPAWQMAEVARRLGLTDRLPRDRERLAEQLWAQDERRLHADPRRAPPPLAELRARPGVLWPFVGGRETRWRYNTAHDPAADRARGEYDFYGHADHRARIWLRPHEPAAEAPDGDYPFWLETGAVLEHSGTGTLTRRVPTLHRAVPRAYVELNPDDAARLGVRDRETVRLVSRRGALELEARVDHRSRPARGCVFVPSFDESLPVSALASDACDPISGQPEGTCAVRVERVAGRVAT